MSNEVRKEAEDTVETQPSADEQTNTEETAEPSAALEAEVAEATETETSSETPAQEHQESGNGEFPEDKQDPEEMDFGAILEQFEQEQVSFHAGELVKGKVVEVSDLGALIDFGYKSEGTVPLEEFTNKENELTIEKGDEIEVVIKSMGSGDNPPSLSLWDAKRRRSWNEIEKSYNEEAVVTGTVTAKTKGGLKVDVNGVEAFLPGSQIDSRPIRNLDALIGEEIEARVIKFSRKRNNIVISRKVITDEVVNKQKAETLKTIREGYIEEGTVKNLTDYGAFVDIGGIDGLLHVTDMSWGRLNNPGDMFKVGDVVQVKILKLDRDKEKVSLGYKQLMPDPWTTVTEIYPVNSKITGKVSSVTEYGAFVELEPGVEGLVHVTEMSWSKRLKHPKHLVKRGDDVEVQVLGIDPDERRISLGIKQLQSNPWDTIAERYSVGSQVKGQVRNLTDFGAFVEIEEGVDGLVHVSDISWSKKIKHPKDVLKKGQEVEAVVTNIDVGERRLSLSIKELTPSAWEQFTNQHKPGDVIKGKISRFASFGVFVELAPELEGLCHISELSDDRIENPEDRFSIGQELDFKILRIEHDVEKIGLSHRAVGKEDEPALDTKSYSSQAKGGMASLGELANLKFGASSENAEAEQDEATSAEETTEEVSAETAETADAVEESAETNAGETEETEVTAENAEESEETDSSAEEVSAEATEDAPAEETEATEEAEVTEETVAAADETSEDQTVESASETETAAESETETESDEEEEVTVATTKTEESAQAEETAEASDEAVKDESESSDENGENGGEEAKTKEKGAES
jgi:small subunit ribosomal protein S1